MVSVLVPVYNIEKYLERCVASLLQQTYEDFEVLLIDDGSTDGSPALCDALAALDDRIRVIHKQNEGVAIARRVGFRESKGSEILFVDGDDYVAPDYIEKLYGALTESGADMAICSFRYVDEENEIMRYPVVRFVKDGLVTAQDALFFYSYRKTDKFYMSVLWNKIYRREVFRETDFFGEKHHSDSYQVPNAIARCKTIRIIPDRLYYYIARTTSLVHTVNTDRIDSLFRANVWKSKFMVRHGGKEAALAAIYNTYDSYLINAPKGLTVRYSPTLAKLLYIWVYLTKRYTSVYSAKARGEFKTGVKSFEKLAEQIEGEDIKRKRRKKRCDWEPLTFAPILPHND